MVTRVQNPDKYSGHVAIDTNVKLDGKPTNSYLVLSATTNTYGHTQYCSYSMTTSPCARIHAVEQKWIATLVLVVVVGVELALCCGCLRWL